MKLGITSKLFMALLATCLMVIFIMSMTLRYTFERGLLDYVNHEDVSRSGMLIKILIDNYKEHDGWEWLREEEHHWSELLMNKYGFPPFDQPLHQHGTRRDDDDHFSDHLSKQLPTDELNLAPRVTVLDARERYLAGNRNPAENAAHEPIVIDGATVGWLLISPYTALTNVMAVTFKNEQAKVTYIISAVSALLAALVAVALARTFLAPIKRLAHGMRLLSSGDYEQSIKVDSGDEMGRLADDFNSLSYTLKKNDQARRQWVADISHELRTPLSVLRGEVEAMQDGVRPLDAESVRSLHAEVMLLSKLVNDLYDLSMSDAGALAYRKENTSVTPIVERVLASYDEKFSSKNIEIELRYDSREKSIVFADETRLGQLFVNLSENSLRYTDAGGKLCVSVEHENGKVVIDFQDTAPGVPSEALPHLFDRLYRVDEARSRERGGAGLGLSICKNIVEAHGGTIEVMPSPLGGLWTRIVFPRAS